MKPANSVLVAIDSTLFLWESVKADFYFFKKFKKSRTMSLGDSGGIRVQDHSLVEMKPFLGGRRSGTEETFGGTFDGTEQPGHPDGSLHQSQQPPIATRITRVGSSVQLEARASKAPMSQRTPHGQEKAIFPSTGGLLSFSLNHLFVLVVCVSFVVISLLPFEAYAAHILFGCFSWIFLNLSM
jgi:hypothetical protein